MKEDDAGAAAVRVTPPDLSIVFDPSSGVEESLRGAVSRGSKDAAFMLGLLLSRTGRFGEAEGLWRDIAASGHAEGLLALALMQAADGDTAGYVSGIRAADAAGAMLAAGALVAIESDAGHPDEAATARERMLRRARTADEHGSADAALVLGGLALEEGDLDRATAAYERAQERGAAAAGVALAQIQLHRGDIDGALVSATRADAGGIASGSYLLAILHQRRREHRQAWDAVHRAVLTAARTGDSETLHAATMMLRPYGRAWWAQHRRLLFWLVLGLAVIAVIEWRWAVALVGLGVAFAVSQRPVVAGMPLEFPDEQSDAVSIMGIGLSGDFTDHVDPLAPQDPRRREATARDHSMWRLSVIVLALFALVLPMWAAGLLDGQLVLRCAAGALATLTCIAAIWQWPHAGQGSDARVPSPNDRPELTVTLTLAPTVFTRTYYRFSLQHPSFEPFVEHRARVRAQQGAGARFVARVAALIPVATSAVILGTFGVAPDQRDAVGEALNLWGVALEALLVAVGLVMLPHKIWLAIREESVFYLFDAAAFLLAVGVAVTLAHQLGWDAPLLAALSEALRG